MPTCPSCLLPRLIRLSVPTILLLVSAAWSASAQDAATDVFAKEVWPVLQARCVECHGPDRQKAGMRLDSPEAIAKGSENGPVLVAGKPDESLLLKRISLPPDDVDIMPPKGDPLTKEQIEAIRRWVEGGASFGDWKGADAPAPPTATATAEKPAEELAPAEASIQTAAPTSDAAIADPYATLAAGVAPAPADALASIASTGGLASTLSQTNPLVRVDLHLLGEKVTDEQVAALAPLKDQLTWLNLAGTKVTDEGLAHLAPFQKLTRLHLERTGITDAGLVHLAGLANLEYLNLYGTAVTDAGLAQLAGLKNLKRVYLWQSKATPEGAAKLQEAIPGVDVNLGTELAAAAAPAEEATPAAAVELAFDEGSCCAKAKAEGKACEHPCCVEAAAAGKVCEKCNPAAAKQAAAAAPAEEAKPADLSALFDKDSCCAKAKAEGKACEHPCCVEAAAAGKVCVKCNPGAEGKGKAAEASAEPAQGGSVVAAVQFNRDIRPIFAENCLACHGMDKNARKANLRLDDPESALGKAILPGDPASSPLLARVSHADPEEVMPPPSAGKRLKAEEVALLERWIREGAPYQPHWSYITPVRPPVPEPGDAAWVRNPIDAFILRALERKGLKPAPEADRVTLIRRLSFDLVGLPPTPAEVDAFVNDAAPDAYEKLVERLLASPHYGERMAIEWLDLVRYADTNGYHGDEYRSVWPYRDYVIQAFNANKPFDRFTIEQLAGDLLPNATVEQKIASAYNRLNQLTAEGGAQEKEYIAKYAADRVRTASTAWLGSTVGCAECHDHKFDPFTTKDFYRFAAFFADVQEKGVYRAGDRWEPILPLPTEEQAAEQNALQAKVAELKQKLENPAVDLAPGQAKWEAEERAALLAEENDWLILSPLSAEGEHGTVLTPQADRSLKASGPDPDRDVYSVTFRTSQRDVTGLRLEVLTDPEFPNGGLSRANGNFVLTGFEVEVCTPDGTCAPVRLVSVEADYSQPGHRVALVLDDLPGTGWAVAGHEKPAPHEAVFAFEEPVAGGPEVLWTVRLRHESGFARHTIGRFRLGITTADNPRLPAKARLDEALYTALRIDPELRSPAEQEVLAKHYRSIAPELQPLRDSLKAEEERLAKLEAEIPYVLTTVSVEPRTVRVLPRGDWMDESGEIVEPGTPEFLPPLHAEDRRPTRLDLAKWLVSRENPLTARVFVNRLWEQYFGTGLSKVLEELGSRGEWPTHPELLDWLAVEFMESGWDVKHMVRLITTSATYRQSSETTPEKREADPYNRLLARQSSLRLPAELIRDNALAISGLLTAKIGGPSVKPYQPDGYWADCNTFTGPLVYNTSTGPDQYRRGLYTFWKRSFLHPSLLAFDAPTREECTADRVPSNTPLQALVLLNDPTYVEAARVFAEHILREGGHTTAERLAWAWRRALGRTPTEQEAAVLEGLCAKHAAACKADPEAARKLLSTGQAPVPEDLDAAELAAWTSVARAILNLHETVSRS